MHRDKSESLKLQHAFLSESQYSRT
jgi:hypothetical protein